jgi:glycine cleavage system H protein
MSFEIPDECGFLESHEWARPEGGDDTVRVGVSDFAQDELGDVVFVELPDEGATFGHEEGFGVVESIKAVSDIYAPVDGTVAEVNDRLRDEPELINEDPYGDGWMVVFDVDDGDPLAGLLSAEEYRDQIE